MPACPNTQPELDAPAGTSAPGPDAQGPDRPVAAGPDAAGESGPGAAPVARGATVMAGLTAASRLVGFGRTLVFAWAVGAGVLGDVYRATNAVPNIVFEIVAGGALASLVVPMLAGPITRQDRSAAGATTSALLTWAATLLVPVAVVVAVAAEPIVGYLLGGGASPQAVAVGSDMLRVFAPQLPLYGVGIVLAGVLQAYRRFVWPVLAPLLSSAVVIVAYVAFVLVAGRSSSIDGVGGGALLVLSGGTTLGVVVLSLCLVVPLRRLRLPLRPTYRFTTDASRMVRQLAVAGAVTVGAQQLTVFLVIKLAAGGPAGTLVLYDLAEKIYLLPWAVLALPVATSAYPALAAAAARRDRAAYAATLAPAVRGLVLLACLGAAGLAALAEPVARALAAVTAGAPPVGAIAAGIAGFAPGLVGYALFALLSRALYARGDTRLAAAATVAGWVAVAAASVGLAGALPGADRVTALAVANSAGMLVLGAVLVAVVAHRAGAAALAGVARAAAAGLVAAVAAAGAGYGAQRSFGPAATLDVPVVVGQGMLGGVVVVVVFAAVAYAADARDVRPALATFMRRVGRRTRRVDERSQSRDREGGAADA